MMTRLSNLWQYCLLWDGEWSSIWAPPSSKSSCLPVRLYSQNAYIQLLPIQGRKSPLSIMMLATSFSCGLSIFSLDLSIQKLCNLHDARQHWKFLSTDIYWHWLPYHAPTMNNIPNARSMLIVTESRRSSLHPSVLGLHFPMGYTCNVNWHTHYLQIDTNWDAECQELPVLWKE